MNAPLSFLFSTSGLATCFLVSAIWLWRRPSSVAARRFLMMTAAAYALATIYIVPFSVSRLLTRGYHQFRATDVTQGTTAIALLAGGDKFVKGWTDHITITSPTEAARILEAWRVFRLVSPAWMISSGGSSAPTDGADPGSSVMGDELIRLGVPRERILLESTSRNTYEQASVIA